MQQKHSLFKAEERQKPSVTLRASGLLVHPRSPGIGCLPMLAQPPQAAFPGPASLCFSSCCCPELQIRCSAPAHHPGGSEELLGSACFLPERGLPCRSCGTGEFCILEEQSAGWLVQGHPTTPFLLLFGVKKALSCWRQPHLCPEEMMAVQSPGVLPRASRGLLESTFWALSRENAA